jgi:hypothetical protein
MERLNKVIKSLEDKMDKRESFDVEINYLRKRLIKVETMLRCMKGMFVLILMMILMG